MPEQIRKKVVTLDGAEFTIAELSLKQVKALAQAGTSSVQVILQSMNRAGGSFTEEQLEEILGPYSRNNLFDEILAFSGLKREAGAAGEPQA